jgi:hypothetical protein
VAWLHVSSRRAAYVVLALLTLVWGFNWICMKAALLHADPLAFNVQRTWLAVAVLFAALVARGGRIGPHSWRAVLITGSSRRRSTFGATTMAVAGGGADAHRCLVFTCRSDAADRVVPCCTSACVVRRWRRSRLRSPGSC